MAVTCAEVPALILLNAHNASFLNTFFGDTINANNAGRTSQSTRCCVCASDPDAMFPTHRSAADCTAKFGCHMKETRHDTSPGTCITSSNFSDVVVGSSVKKE